MSGVFTFEMLVGLPFSGKTTYCENIKKSQDEEEDDGPFKVILSRDSIVSDLCCSLNFLSPVLPQNYFFAKNRFVLNQLNNEIVHSLKLIEEVSDCRHIVYDAMNLQLKTRASLMTALKMHYGSKVHFICRFFNEPVEVLTERAAACTKVRQHEGLSNTQAGFNFEFLVTILQPPMRSEGFGRVEHTCAPGFGFTYEDTTPLI